MSTLQPYDHVRVGEDGPVPAGIYRVVGTGEETALLRVGTIDGRRVTTGEVVHVECAKVEQFETAENPDSGPSLGAVLAPFKAVVEAVRYRLPF
ncbi:hypothetical protein [Salinibaculum salinum]|uniref:hypothetical protein n=1 Tax=Salinibaculum salinum TaxID=3131996 RepID=UPI0030EB4877